MEILKELENVSHVMHAWDIFQDEQCRLLISQDVGKIGFRQISLNIYILYQK